MCTQGMIIIRWWGVCVGAGPGLGGGVCVCVHGELGLECVRVYMHVCCGYMWIKRIPKHARISSITIIITVMVY